MNTRLRALVVTGLCAAIANWWIIPIAHADTLDWQYKAPCNPYTTNQTNDVVPGYYYNVSGQCIYGNVDALQYPTPNEYSDHGLIFMNGYTPAWDNKPNNYYNNQSFSNSFGGNKGHGGH